MLCYSYAILFQSIRIEQASIRYCNRNTKRSRRGLSSDPKNDMEDKCSVNLKVLQHFCLGDYEASRHRVEEATGKYTGWEEESMGLATTGFIKPFSACPLFTNLYLSGYPVLYLPWDYIQVLSLLS